MNRTIVSEEHQSLIFIRDNDRLLLGLKKRNFGVNKWNGYGGKCEPNEEPIECAVRELKEESGLSVKRSDLCQIGLLRVEMVLANSISELRIVHVFVTMMKDLFGKAVETDEMKPQWFQIKSIPFDDMWADARYWIPLLLQGRKFLATIFRHDEHVLDDINIKLCEQHFE